MVNYPVAVFAADWTLIAWNAMWSALIGDPHQRPLADRNLIRATFYGSAAWTPIVRIDAEAGRPDEKEQRALVADLRHAVTTYPDDEALRALVAEVRAASPPFRELWDSGAAGRHASTRKLVQHPLAGELVLDCDVLTAPDSDLKIILYTAAAGSRDSERLDFLRVSAVHSVT
ncbi:MmyB family transcriptional regulator [Nonomuraea glycinis]|uniref:MmyB family transcriptional regulator n=1 Tax=Nonomuraea glycinis TaxID=2047744 RepID=UPI00339F6096